ncbi:phosphotransferase [Novosphingobium rosa]|uniref:phosphotransferase n=1 Tax=Novosphingobium rosa TaxID=76978 RepID=UPI000831CE83|nr:phosphotransferase [Novosphingobium rosa]
MTFCARHGCSRRWQAARCRSRRFRGPVAAIPESDRAAYYDETNRVIAALHTVDVGAIGLGDFGRPGNYFSRQITRWSRQYRADDLAERDGAMDALAAWLPSAIPEGAETALIHGDFRIDNVIFHPDEPRILAVLDRELSTLSLPTLEAHVAAYCARTGRSGIPNWNFHLAFNEVRLAAIVHGIKGRVLRGNASNAQASERAKAFPRLAALGAGWMDKL